MIGDYFSKMAAAQKLNPAQQQQSVQNGILTPNMAQDARQGQPKAMPQMPAQEQPQGLEGMAQQVMQEASQAAGPNPVVLQQIAKLRQEIPQIQKLIEIDKLKPYEGIPLLKEKVGMLKKLEAQVQPSAGLGALPTAQEGVAALPTGMNEQSFAGGGIVAFSEGGYNPWSISAPSASGLDKRIYEAIKNKLSEWNKPWGKTVDATPEEIRGAMTGKNLASEKEKFAPAPTAEQTANFMGDLNPTSVKTSGVQFDPTAGGTYSPPKAPARVFSSAPPAAPNAEAPPPPPPPPAQAAAPKNGAEDQFAPLAQLLQEDRENKRREHEGDKWSRIAEAGFNMMAGSSPYALTNIGAGAAQAMKGYQSDVAAARKDETEAIKSMVALGMKKNEMAQTLGLKDREFDLELKKLGITEKLSEKHGNYYDLAGKALATRAAAAGSGAGSTTKMDIAKLNAVKSTFATLQKGAGDMMSPNYGKSPEELWAMAESMVTGQSNAVAAPAPVGTWSPKSGYKPNK